MADLTVSNPNSYGLAWLIKELDACESAIDESKVRAFLARADLNKVEVSPYVEMRAEAYARRCVVRRENFEVLVLTWMPTQESVAHDHSGSLCGLKVVQGRLVERLYEEGPDGRVRQTIASRQGVGEISVDPGVVVHSLANDSLDEVLVTVHIYSPPLPQVRRYAVADSLPPKLFTRPSASGAKVIAIVGGGATGLMTLANLLRFGTQSDSPLHIVLIDRQPAAGEGIAYRTVDGRHLLNVPASSMSAWPDMPDDFLSFAQERDPGVRPGDFLPRKIYGQYVRETMLKLAESAGEHLSATMLHDEVSRLARLAAPGWTIETRGGRSIRADLVILAVGHRPPKDPFALAWNGPRGRFVANPWASLLLSQIGPSEPVLLIGSGLTAVDIILTLARPDRTAPLIAISRRGLMPMTHLREQKLPADASVLIEEWLAAEHELTTRELVLKLRSLVLSGHASGIEWQRVLDAIRPATPRLWARLAPQERSRFLRHARAFWEVHRHRMAPAIADKVAGLREAGVLRVAAGTLVSANADVDGIDVTYMPRGKSSAQEVRVSWVVNCTGPGAHNRHETHPFLRPLLHEGTLANDELCLGLLTDESGRALNASGHPYEDLFVAGTLRKATLWESTAVPELRRQAQTVAQKALCAIAMTSAGTASGCQAVIAPPGIH